MHALRWLFRRTPTSQDANASERTREEKNADVVSPPVRLPAVSDDAGEQLANAVGEVGAVEEDNGQGNERGEGDKGGEGEQAAHTDQGKGADDWDSTEEAATEKPASATGPESIIAPESIIVGDQMAQKRGDDAGHEEEDARQNNGASEWCHVGDDDAKGGASSDPAVWNAKVRGLDEAAAKRMMRLLSDLDAKAASVRDQYLVDLATGDAKKSLLDKQAEVDADGKELIEKHADKPHAGSLARMLNRQLLALKVGDYVWAKEENHWTPVQAADVVGCVWVRAQVIQLSARLSKGVAMLQRGTRQWSEHWLAGYSEHGTTSSVPS
jgi:hypothetical protein